MLPVFPPLGKQEGPGASFRDNSCVIRAGLTPSSPKPRAEGMGTVSDFPSGVPSSPGSDSQGLVAASPAPCHSQLCSDVPCLSFPTWHMEMTAALPGGFGCRDGFGAEFAGTQQLQGAEGQRGRWWQQPSFLAWREELCLTIPPPLGDINLPLPVTLPWCCPGDALSTPRLVSHAESASTHPLHLPRKAGEELSPVTSSKKRCLGSQRNIIIIIIMIFSHSYTVILVCKPQSI